MWTAIEYVELNPVRAGTVRRAEEYPWSSARERVGLENGSPLKLKSIAQSARSSGPRKRDSGVVQKRRRSRGG